MSVQLKAIFFGADTDRDGELTFKELSTVLRKKGYNFSDEEVKVMFEWNDTSGVQKISMEEFLAVMEKLANNSKDFTDNHKCPAGNKETSTQEDHSLEEGQQSEDETTPTEFRASENAMAMQDKYKDLFDEADTNGDGLLSFDELSALLNKNGYNFSQEEVENMFVSTDINGDGVISLDEFRDAMDKQAKAVQGKLLGSERSLVDEHVAFFREADIDGDGYLTFDELKDILGKKGYKLSDQEIRKMHSNFDTSGDGKISKDEFLVGMGHQSPNIHGLAEMRRVFVEFDKDGNGRIDKNELMSVFKEQRRDLTSEEVEKIIKLFAKDGSDELEYEEFLKAVFNVQL